MFHCSTEKPEQMAKNIQWNLLQGTPTWPSVTKFCDISIMWRLWWCRALQTVSASSAPRVTLAPAPQTLPWESSKDIGLILCSWGKEWDTQLWPSPGSHEWPHTGFPLHGQKWPEPTWPTCSSEVVFGATYHCWAVVMIWGCHLLSKF